MHSARWMKVWEINEDLIFLWRFASYQNEESEVIIMYLSLYASMYSQRDNKNTVNRIGDSDMKTVFNVWV